MKLILFLIGLLLIPIGLATTDVEINIATEEDMEAEINLYSNNLNLEINGNGLIEYFGYNTPPQTDISTSGTTTNGFMKTFRDMLKGFRNGRILDFTFNSKPQKLFKILDAIFVNEKEMTLYSIYLEDRIDKLEQRIEELENPTIIYNP